jgi:monoamine oxidase
LIAIIGGGVAELTAAYRLQQHCAKPVLFEASNPRARLGGQCQGHEWHHVARVAESRLGSSSPVEGHALFRSRIPDALGDAGIITDYLGSKPGISDAKSALHAFCADLPKMSPEDGRKPRPECGHVRSVYPFALGGYASAKTGQYTTLLELAAEPALHGRLQFAGEHTSTDFPWFHEWGSPKR